MSISYLIVYPKNRHRAVYYVNDNLRDSHAMNYEDLYKWICEYITPPTTSSISYYLQTFQPFIVDMENNDAIKLRPSDEEISQEQLRRNREIDFSDVYEKAQKEYTENEDSILGSSLGASSNKKDKVENDSALENVIKNMLGT